MLLQSHHRPWVQAPVLTVVNITAICQNLVSFIHTMSHEAVVILLVDDQHLPSPVKLTLSPRVLPVVGYNIREPILMSFLKHLLKFFAFHFVTKVPFDQEYF